MKEDKIPYLIQMEITKPRARIEIILSWRGVGGSAPYIPTEIMDNACEAIRVFMEGEKKEV